MGLRAGGRTLEIALLSHMLPLAAMGAARSRRAMGGRPPISNEAARLSVLVPLLIRRGLLDGLAAVPRRSAERDANGDRSI